MSNKPLFSIIVPTYNQSQYIGAALDSIISQTDGDWEAIVINDGSTDATREAMEEYACKDSRIRIFHKPNGGVASALNEGLKKVRGQWVCWLSSDDMFDSCKLNTHRKWIKRYPDSKFFFTYFRLLRETTGKITDHDLWGPLPERDFQVIGLFYRNYISGISICINREAWNQIGEFDEGLCYAQDIDMWLRLLAVYPGRFIPEWTCINRNHALQGSEEFPQACYYDTAKAIIRFLNEHRFEELFPLLDLKDPQTARRALKKSLEIASEPSGFIYSLGPHAALLLRITEWIYDEQEKQDPYLQQELKEMLSDQVSLVLKQYTGTYFAFIWKIISAIIQVQHSGLKYTAFSPSIVGKMYYYSSQSAGNAFLQPLKIYLDRFDGVQVNTSSQIQHEEEMVVVIPSDISLSNVLNNQNMKNALKIFKYLAQMGYRVLLIGHSEQRIGILEGFLFLGGEDETVQKKLAKGFGRTDILATLSHADTLRWVKASRKIRYRLPEVDLDCYSESQKLHEIIESTPVQKRQQIAFISRVPWGGGAERVVYDLVHGLDKERFEPHIIFLLDQENVPVAFKPDIQLHYVSPILRRLIAQTKNKGIYGLMKRIYCSLLEPLIRNRLKLTTRLKRLLNKIYLLANLSQPNRISQLAKIHSRSLTNHSKWLIQNNETATPSLNVVESNADIWLSVLAIREILSSFRDDAILVPIMEEATVRVWLNQFFKHYIYVSSLHSVESYNMKLMYSDTTRYMIEERRFVNACKSANIVIVPSNGCKDDLVQNFGLPTDHIQCISNPVNIDLIHKESKKPLTIEIKERKTQYIYVGRLDQDKNPALLLEAANLLRRRYDDFAIYYLGQGALVDEIKNRIKYLDLQDHVFLLGQLVNPFPLMTRARALILTSHVESFALVLLEAMICGAIPIAVDCPFGPREVLDNGKFGLLVPPNDARALADAMWQIAQNDNLYIKLRALGLERAQDYDLNKIIQKWEQLFFDLQQRSSKTLQPNSNQEHDYEK